MARVKRTPEEQEIYRQQQELNREKKKVASLQFDLKAALQELKPQMLKTLKRNITKFGGTPVGIASICAIERMGKFAEETIVKKKEPYKVQFVEIKALEDGTIIETQVIDPMTNENANEQSKT